MKFCVIGIGRFGYQVAVTLADNGMDVLVVDNNESIISSIKDKVSQAICMRVTDEDSLRAIGIEEIDIVIVATGESLAQSILITTLLKKRLNMPRIIARASSNIHKEILDLVGADQVVIPEQELGIKLADQLSSPLPQLTRISQKFGVIPIAAPDKFIHERVEDLNLYEDYRVSCIGYKKGEEFEPISPNYVIAQNDILLFAGPEDDLEKITELN